MSTIRVFTKKHMTLTLRDPRICPVCGGEGYGVHFRWATEPQYGPYAYFAHPNGARNNRGWCYLGTEITLAEAPDSICLLCPILDDCNPASTFAACRKDDGEGSAGSEQRIPPSPFPSSEIGGPPSKVFTLKGTDSEPLNPSPHERHCTRCGANYPETTETKCPTCGGWLIMKNHGHYS